MDLVRPDHADDPDREPEWEWGMIQLGNDLALSCNAAAKKGWEVVQVFPQPDQSVVALAKRKAQRIQVASAVPSGLTSGLAISR